MSEFSTRAEKPDVGKRIAYGGKFESLVGDVNAGNDHQQKTS